jgi:PAS domain S-box-containing protein
MVLARTDGRIVFANAQAEQLFEYTREELIGQLVELLVPERLRARHPMLREAYFDKPGARPMGGGTQLFGRRKNGSEFPADISLSPMITDGGSVVIAAIRDVSDRKKAEQEHVRLAHVEEALRLRDEFLSIASHELRTPLAALQLRVDGLNRLVPKLTDAMRGDPVVARVLQNVDGIGASSVRIDDLITSLLDSSRITSGRLELQRLSIDVSAVVRRAVEERREESARCGCALELEAPLPVIGEWDGARIEQVVANLISNAMKFGAGKPITVSVTQPTEGTARIAIRDQGIGIAKADSSRIFQRFERAVSSRNYAGFGLGLWTAQQIIDAHSGEIYVTSDPGSGAMFTVDLPIQPGARPSFLA